MRIRAILFLIITILLTLIFNGNLLNAKLGIPPLAKIMNPFHGLWSELDNRSRIVLNGKDGEVEIIRDNRGVPHIFAATMEDAFFGQGYIEASDRLFQMHFLKAVATGQVSSIFGKRARDYDRWTHRKGIPAAVRQTAIEWSSDPEVQSSHNPYIDGVNAFISQMGYKDRPVEMKLLKMTPNSWDMYSACSIFKYMGNVLAGGNYDIEHTNTKHLLGAEDYDRYFNHPVDTTYPVIPTSVTYAFDTLMGRDKGPDKFFSGPVKNAYYDKRDPGVGSNNWALRAAKSATGQPMLSSDPHLSLTLPSIWYEVNIITPEHDIYGVSFPGIPGIMIGFNKEIAWAETNVGHDMQDLYLIRYTDESREKYWLDGKETAIQYRYDTIFIKDALPHIDTTRLTHWGPIIRESLDGKTDIAMDWLVAHKAPASEGSTFVRAMQCQDYDCFLKETSTFITPAQNFIYADAKNNIGLRVNGLLPARQNLDGKFIEIGEERKAGWVHFIPRDQNPQALNPPQEYLASANQRSADPTYPYYYHTKFEQYRNRAINGILDSTANFTIDDLKRLQNNNFSVKAEDFVPILLRSVGSLTPSPWLDTLAQWNFQYNAHLSAPTLFNKWISYIEELTYDEINAHREEMATIYPSSSTLHHLMLNAPDDTIFDIRITQKDETARDIISMAWDSVLTNIEAVSPDELVWGKANGVHIPHLARFTGLGSGPLFASGYKDAINALRENFGPSWRMVVELGKRPKAYGIYPGGPSGDPRSQRFDHMITKWVNGEYDEIQYGFTQTQLLESN